MKKLKILLLLLIFSLAMIGCGMSYDNDDKGLAPNDDIEEVLEIESSVNRKIIYTVDAHISTKDLAETYKNIKNSLAADEWADSEDLSTGVAYLTLRIKSDRLDSFINSLSSYGDVGNYRRSAQDVSLTYENHANKIASLEAERTRLNELYEDASINEMIIIGKRLAEIDLEIGNLSGELKKFDSLVDYSVVNLKIYEHKLEKEETFRDSISEAFVGGWNAVLTFLKFIVIALSALVPFLIIIIPVSGAIYFGYRYYKKKKM